MDLVALLAIQVVYAIASLALMSVGLAIIFGMMKVINLAHGEFLMLGGYAAIEANRLGLSIWIAMLIVAPIVVGAIGIIVERTIIRWLYGRMIDTMLATWGLSLFLVGLTTAVFGNTTVGLSAPLGSFEIGQYRTSAYTLFVIGVTIVVLGGMGSVPGALIGGLVIGVVESLGGFFFGESLGHAGIFLIFIAVLLIRPRGLFGATA